MHPAPFEAELVVRLQHTDAAGVIFYPRLLEMEEELFERWLESGGLQVAIRQLQAWRGAALGDGTRLAPLNPVLVLVGRRP